ncbi:hypothetical protein [Yeosuana marina]|uniref:hypothetical protein n=1 Tax=Yeosuana marina TaxID=1565536 RepID=UPI0030C8CE03
MSIKMLSNKYKRIGLILFISGLIVGSTSISARQNFFEGWNAGSGLHQPIPALEPIFIEKYFGAFSIHVFDVIMLLGLIVYMLSKEKIEDDYINTLRLESFQLTSLLALTSAIILYIFSEDLKLSLDVFITLFLLAYLITFAIKKRLY